MSDPGPGHYESAESLDSIAITGMACRFPGANSIEQFWRNLCDGVESITPVSNQDLLDAGVKPAAARDPRHVPVASTLTGIESFDAGFFDFSPRQAKITDPQQRFFLECAWEALESAGYDPAACGQVIGLFAGCSMSTYLLFNLYSEVMSEDSSSGLQLLIGNDKDYLATQVAYKLNLTGPAVNVQTACSTSLVAVHLASQSLLNHECDMALAGGVTVRLPARAGYIYEEGSILSPDGHCRPLDANAQGTVFGSGVGVVVLKRLADALADGDAIDAVIKGTAINNDGSAKAGFTAPGEDGQAKVVAEALAVAGVEPRTVQYVELHGTGTRLGDPIEIAALTRAFRSRAGTRPLAPGTCAVGAVKSNFGHLESAAGIAGLLKAVLALKHGRIPPTLHFQRPNPAIDFAQTPFYVNTQLSAWEAEDTPRRACVSSFGIGGTNAHAVLEEAPPAAAVNAAAEPETDRPYVLPLSARHPAALAALAQAYHDFLADGGPGASASLRDICWSASLRRKHHPHRLAVVGRTRAELVTQLADAGTQDAGARAGRPTGRRPKVAFVFPGHGSQWIGMGRRLLEREPVFREAVKRCDQVLHGYTDFSVAAELSRQNREGSLESAESIQLTLFAIEIGLVELWRSLGVAPDAVVGHSMGEIAAAHVAGALSLEDTVRVLCHRSRLIQQTLGRGRMLAVGLPQNQARELTAGHETQVSLAISNSPKSTVLSGDPTALASIAAHLQSKGTFHRWVNIGFASHSPQMDPLLMELRQALRDVRPQQASVPIASTVTGGECDGTGMDAGYWARNLREPVLFCSATRWLVESGCDVFVEISPHPILLPSIEDSLYHLDRAGIVVPSLLRDADEQRSLLEALGALYRAGQPIEWGRLYPKGGRYTRLPGYPWQRQRYWVDQPRHAQPAAASGDTPAFHPLLGRRLRSALNDGQFESHVSPVGPTAYLGDHRVCGQVILPGTAYLEMFWQATAHGDGGPCVVTDVVLHEPLILGDEEGQLVQTILTPDAEGQGRLQVFSWEEEAAVWRLHATGGVRAAPPDGAVTRRDLSGIWHRCPREVDPPAYYARLREAGMEYGPWFRGIESLRLGDGEVIGQVRLPEAPPAGYAVHPALLDAGLQLIGPLLVDNPLAPDGTSPDGDGAEHVYLPSDIASFHVVRPTAQGPVIAHARLHDDDGTHPERKSGDVVLYDEQGELVAEVRGLGLTRVHRAALRRMLQPDLHDWFYELRWRRQPYSDADSNAASRPQDSAADTGEGRRWLILADRGGVGRALMDLLAKRGEAATLVFPAASYRHDATHGTFHIRPSHPEDFTRLLDDGRTYHDVIYLWGLDATSLEMTTTASLSSDEALICGGALHLSKAVAGGVGAVAQRMWFVTRGAQAPETGCALSAPAQAPLWGFGRTLRLEHPNIHCRLVDLDTTDAEQSARTLLGEAAAADQEGQVALHHSERFVARLVRAPRPDAALTSSPPGQSLQLTMASRGALDNLAFKTVPRRAPGAGEVEVRVRATGLNFRDVLNVLGGYPGDPGPLGAECAGEIASVGEGVTEFQAGDEVVALTPGSFATFVTVPAVYVAKKPPKLTFAEAATIPITFMTAYYALCQLARISKDDKILIHSAAGGLGLAATQLARRAGAEVFGTAGTDEKRDYLRSLGLEHVLHSRTLDFAAEVMERTGGRGVDIVLNPLTGEYIARNFSVLAPGGRFVEVGKIGVWDADRVRHERPDASYFILDLDQEARRDPASFGEMLRQLMREFDQGMLTPLPQRVFPLYDVTSAFQFMAQAKHIGKIVASQEVGLSSIAADRLNADASYLVTGGLGVLGLRVARWMADQGARHLVLIGRGRPSTAAQAVVGNLTRAGIKVLVIGADVSQEDQLARALETIDTTMPPLRGVIHAAGVVDDGIIMRQDWKRFSPVLAPKVQGAWNLHTLTRHRTLDFFVLYSSINGLLGNGGQSSYAAANAFLDALAHMRRARGLPALSINWGGWSETGLAVRGDLTARMARVGMVPITPGSGLQALGQAMRRQAPQVAVMPIDWATFLTQFPAGGVPDVLTEMSRGQLRPDGRQSVPGQSDLKRRLDATVPGSRRSVLARYLQEQARAALGIDPATPIDSRQPLNELGLDSLRAIGMRSTLSTAVGRTLPATILFDYPTIEGLTGYLADEVLGLSRTGWKTGGGLSGDTTAAAPKEVEPETGAADVMKLSAEELPTSLADEVAAIQNLLNGSEA